MARFRNILTTLALGLSVAAAVTPAYAKGRAEAGYNGSGYPIAASRAAALRECSAREGRDLEYLWGVTEIQVYRACMIEHGQSE